MNNDTHKQPYEAPSFTEFELKMEGVVCASGEGTLQRMNDGGDLSEGW